MSGQTPRTLHANLDQESFDTWHLVAQRSETTVTGLLEALAEAIGVEIDQCGDSDLVRQDWVRSARKIDARRRRRGRAPNAMTGVVD